MFCTNCGKKITEDSKFCQFCGSHIGDKKVNDKTGTETTRSTVADNLWDKFVDVYNSKGEEREKWENQTSNEAWELLDRISTNSFESFIEEHKDVLNKQPYKVLESLKSTYLLTTVGGYWLRISEMLLKNELGKLRPIELEKFIEEWKRAAIENYAQTSKNLSEELMLAMSHFHNFRMDALFEAAASIKELPNEFIEKLKSALLMQIVWGYVVGQIESAFRK